jgi:tetratricopeptide (TPR) repeat protein
MQMTAAWKKLLAWSVLGVALSAVAQVNMRPEVAKPLQAAQEAIQAKQPDVALQKIQEARATPQLTEPEKMYLERLSVVAAMDAQKFDVASSSLAYLLQSKELSATDRATLTQTMVSVSQRNKDHAQVVQWARRYAQEGGKNQRVHVMKVQALALQGLHKDVVQEMNEAYKAVGYQAEEAELRIYAFSQKQIKDDAGYANTLTQLVMRFPNKDYWSDLLNSMGRVPGINARTQLDVSRLMDATGTMEEAEDYLDAAQFAIKAGLPYEALRMLDQGQAAGLYKGATATSAVKLKQQAQQRAAEDDKAIKSLSSATGNGSMLVQLGDVLLSKGQWAEAAEAYQKAVSSGSLKHETQARLHCGIALFKAQQAEQAKTMLQSVTGDASAVQMARLWMSLVK